MRREGTSGARNAGAVPLVVLTQWRPGLESVIVCSSEEHSFNVTASEESRRGRKDPGADSESYAGRTAL